MNDQVQPATPAVAAPVRPRRRRWRRRLLITAVALVGLLFVSVWAYSHLPVEAPLGLPGTAASAPVGDIDGTWHVADGSTAGFRIEQTILGMTSEIVGRTGALTGTVTIADRQVDTASFEIDLTTVEANGKMPPQFAISLDTPNAPRATISLEQPVALDPTFVDGQTVSTTVAAELELRGTTHAVTLTISGRRDGTTLEFAGSIPVAFSDWDIPDPVGYGWFASVADHATAEFLVVLARD